jgi:hypothetical protein
MYSQRFAVGHIHLYPSKHWRLQGFQSRMQEVVQSILKIDSWQKHRIVYTKNLERLLGGFLYHRYTSELSK